MAETKFYFNGQEIDIQNNWEQKFIVQDFDKTKLLTPREYFNYLQTKSKKQMTINRTVLKLRAELAKALSELKRANEGYEKRFEVIQEKKEQIELLQKENKTLWTENTKLKSENREFSILNRGCIDENAALMKSNNELTEAISNANTLSNEHLEARQISEDKFKDLCIAFGVRAVDGSEKIAHKKEVGINIDVIADEVGVEDIRSMTLLETKRLGFRLSHITELAE